jgi:hypothetical protein
VVNFRVYYAVIIQAPVLQDPPDNTTIQTQRPTFTVRTRRRRGRPVRCGTVRSRNRRRAGQSHVSIVMNETPNSTSYTVPVDLTPASRYFWRVKALDPGHESSYSPTRTFLTPVAAPPPPSPVPIPQPSPGGGAAADQLNMSQATILNSPFDLPNWPITTAITELNIRPSGISIEFSKKDGPGRWPDVTPPGWTGALQYTLGCASTSRQVVLLGGDRCCTDSPRRRPAAGRASGSDPLAGPR